MAKCRRTLRIDPVSDDFAEDLDYLAKEFNSTWIMSAEYAVRFLVRLMKQQEEAQAKEQPKVEVDFEPDTFEAATIHPAQEHTPTEAELKAAGITVQDPGYCEGCGQ